MCGNIFVFRPGGTPVGNVFTDWQVLINTMACVDGRKILEFDDSFLPPQPPPFCPIPAGVWPMKDVMWTGFGPRPSIPRTTVHILSGAVFTDLRMIGGQLTIVNLAQSPDPPPISDFGTRDHLHIGMRDDCGNTQLVNKFDVPMFDLKGQSALFFVQNCLLGMPTTDVTSPTSLIRQTTGSVLTINLLGQNQTGPNVVLSDGGGSVLFGALSSSAQVAFDQTKITSGGGSYSFGPQGRIQRLVIPRPPLAPPATASQPIPTPNALVLCDGTHPGFTQVLPAIANGFGIGGNLSVPLYTGGQEIVVAEVKGGSKLKVSPFGTDTIDGEPSPVHISKHGSRTFASDGVSNWITISEVRRAE
ncbi:MAG TPA: hypothetical protein VN881_00565 [Candidatus Acidoferrales bacterium]|nr:hypothetical protein [Candidatus Acidoferrales bacterium]